MSMMWAPPRTWRRAISPASSYFSAAISSRNRLRTDHVGPLTHDDRADALLISTFSIPQT